MSALAGGGPKNDFAPSPDYVGVFVFSGRFLRVGDQEGMEMQNLSRFGRFLATEKKTKMMDLGCWSIENTAKNQWSGPTLCSNHV